MSRPVFKTYELPAGSTERLEVRTTRWLNGETLATFEPDLTGVPALLSGQVIGAGVVQFLLEVPEGTPDGDHFVPVRATSTSGRATLQYFILRIQGA